tara:strand:- start:1928 stop:2404 length:477 start_codon:yes stop_codon:yes gene_type:complete
MKKMIKINYFLLSSNWSKRLIKIKKITNNVIKEKINLKFNHKINYYLNIILANDASVKKLNLKYRRKNKTTDVLTFVNEIKQSNKKTYKYCDIFFSAETIKFDAKKNNIDFYDNFCHLLIHSFLHINGYYHNNINDFKKMKKKEVNILNKIGLENPYY